MHVLFLLFCCSSVFSKILKDNGETPDYQIGIHLAGVIVNARRGNFPLVSNHFLDFPEREWEPIKYKVMKLIDNSTFFRDPEVAKFEEGGRVVFGVVTFKMGHRKWEETVKLVMAPRRIYPILWQIAPTPDGIRTIPKGCKHSTLYLCMIEDILNQS